MEPPPVRTSPRGFGHGGFVFEGVTAREGGTRYDRIVSAYRLRRAGREFLVIDREALIQMAANGQVRHGDDAWYQERWQPVGALPELQGKLGADPWSAWEENDGAGAESIVARFQAPDAEPEEIAPDAIEPVPPPEGRRLVVRRPPEPTLVPEDLPDDDRDAPSPGPDEAGERGQVIDFPRPRRPIDRSDMPPNTPRGPPPVVRASRVLMGLFLGGCLLALGWLYMSIIGSSEGTQAPKVRPPATTTATPLVGSGPADDALHQMVASLRTRLPQEVQTVKKPGDLGDAILIELQNLQTSVEGVDATVTQWTGPKGDRPKSASVVVTFHDTQSLNRDLLSFGLVLGRYQRAYPELKIPDARVVFHADDGDRGLTIDAESCLEVYSARITVQKYLELAGGS